MLPSIKHRFQLKLNQFLQLSNKSKQLNVLKHFDHVSKDFKVCLVRNLNAVMVTIPAILLCKCVNDILPIILLQDHISEIDNKLVSIMDSVFENNLSKWEVKAPMPSREFRMVCRQMTKLHEMIYDLLPEVLSLNILHVKFMFKLYHPFHLWLYKFNILQEQTRRILHEMHKHFKTRLKQMLQQYGVRNNGGPQYGLVMSDVAFYQGNIKVYFDKVTSISILLFK